MDEHTPQLEHDLTPETIETRDFLVVVHGYHKGEVREFLTTVSAAYSEALARLERASTSGDDFDSLGSAVAGVLRTANDAATEMTTMAELTADETIAAAKAEADGLRAAAQRAVDDARQEAAAIIRDAQDRAATIGADAAAELQARIGAVAEHEQALRIQLEELGRELVEAQAGLDRAFDIVDLRQREPATR